MSRADVLRWAAGRSPGTALASLDGRRTAGHVLPRRPERGAARGGPADRGAAARRRRRRLREDARADLPRRPPDHGAWARSRTRSSRSRSRTRPRARCARASTACSATARGRSGSSRSTLRAGASCAARPSGSACAPTSPSTTRPTRSASSRPCSRTAVTTPSASPRAASTRRSRRRRTLLVSPAEYRERVASFYDQTVADVYERYQERLHRSNALDFDDMLFLTVEVLERFPEARERWQKAFRYILVDEYQDTNRAQYRLLQILGREAPQRVCRRGPGPVDLRLQRRGHPQHPRVRARLPRGADRRAGAELPLDQRDPRGGQRRHRAQQRAQAEAPLVGARPGRPRARAGGGGRERRGPLRRRRDRPPARRGLLRARDRDLLPHERAVAGASSRPCGCPGSATR